MIVVATCPICQSSNWQNVFPVKDHSISREIFSLKKCNACSFLITSPRPQDSELSKYYQSDIYISHSGKSNGLVNSIYLLARRYSLKWKLRLVNRIQPKGMVLDIGCGTGEFIQTLKKDDWKVFGVEPNDSARQKAQTLVGMPIAESLDALNGPFNLISLWHVLEHLPTLGNSLAKIHECLDPNGTLLIAVPNHRSYDAQRYGENWAGYDVPRHLWHFSKETMVLLLRKSGFKLIETIPMKLDAYYVSILSEKYNGSSSPFTKGILSGLTSNQAAKKTGEYSSLIYIAGK